MSEPRFFIARLTGQEGPLTVAEVRAGLASGRFRATELSWAEEGEREWLPLGERPEFAAGAASAPAPMAPDSPFEVAIGPLPETQRDPLPELPPRLAGQLSGDQIEMARRAALAWRRFLARIFDVNVGSAVILLLSGVDVATLQRQPQQLGLVLLCAALWPWIEGVLLATLGTTPGKALLRLRVVTADGSRPGLGMALARALRVWVQGAAMWLPIANLLAWLFAFNRYTRHGSTAWDQACGTRVEALPISQARMTLVVGLFFGAALVELLASLGAGR